MWNIAKTTIARYGKQIVMAAVQGMVNDMKTELQNRANLLAQIRVSVAKLQNGLNDAAQYDWWEDFIAAVNLSDQQLRLADMELSQAYDSSRDGNWNTDRIEKGQWRLLVAYQKLADAGEIDDLISEIGSDFRSSPYLPFDPAFLPIKQSDLWSALSTISEALDEISTANSCLFKTTLRLQQLRQFIFAAKATLDWLDSQAAINISLDIIMNDAIIASIINTIRSTRLDMRRVINDRNRLTAPASLAVWKVTILGQIELLNTFSSLPTPWGIESYGEEATAIDELNYLLYAHHPKDGVMAMEQWDFSATFVTDIISSILRSAGDIVALISNNGQWNSNITRAMSRISDLELKDTQARNMLNAFSGHDSDKYDYILNLLLGSEMGGAARMVERGDIKGLMEATVYMAVTAGSALSCLSSMFGDRAGMSAQTQQLIENLFDSQYSEARSKVRAINTLPSLQLQSMGALRLQLSDALNQITALSNLSESGC